MLSDNKLSAIIQRGESDRVEFTQATTDFDKFRQAICAFANDMPDHRKPGLIFVGIKDDGSCAGLTIDDQLLQTLGGLRNDGKILPFPSMEVDKKILNGCEIAVIQVKPSDNPPVKVDGRCWIRIGPRRGQATSDEERRLTEKRQWGNLPFDMQGVKNTSIEEDLDIWKFENEYLPSAIPPEVMEANDRDREAQLRALRLTTQDRTPTVTAILMLGKEPSYWFPGAYIQFVRYAGNQVTDPILDQTVISGPLPDQLREIDSLLKRNIAIALNTRGETHIEEPDYPYEALRELVRNAVIHRNYDSTNTPVRIYWFANRVEIISPGSVYGEVTKENFENFRTLNITAYRNPTIAEAMKNMGFMQRFGIGISTAYKALEENGNPELKFEVEDTVILAEIRKRQ